MRTGSPLTIVGVPPRYQLLEYLSRGQHSDVVEAINRDRNSTAVALKLIHADGSHEAVARLMFRREVEALKGLSHDAIVQIYDAFEGEGRLLGIELELVPSGWSLKKLLEEVRVERISPPSPEWRIRQASRMADAVLAAHRRAIVHRDIKPGNVLWNRDDETLKLADFGIAAVLELTARDPSGGTLRNFYSRPYASPEQMLQRPPQLPSDVYSFGLLVVALLTLREPGEDFERSHLPGLLAGVVDELRLGGVSSLEIDTLIDTLTRAVLEDPAQRPSLTEIQDVLGRLLRIFTPRVEASITLTQGARDKLHGAGFVSDAKILEDLNSSLRVRLERDDRGELVRIYGRTLFAILRPETRDPNEVRARDAGQNSGPTHESHRRAAAECPIRLRLGRGSGVALFEYARRLDRLATLTATQELVERARLIISIERERLPVFEVDGTVEGGQRIASTREDRIGRAAGFAGAQVERVEVTGGFLLRVAAPRLVLSPKRQNVVKQRLTDDGVSVEEPEFFDDASQSDWYALFDDLADVEVLDEHGHLAGKVTGYDSDKNVLQVQTDKKRNLLRRGAFFVKNYQKERQLRQQEIAIDTLARGESARADMAQLLGEASVHRMGRKHWVELPVNRPGFPGG